MTFKYNINICTKGHLNFMQILQGTNRGINPESCKPCGVKSKWVLPQNNAPCLTFTAGRVCNCKVSLFTQVGL